MYSMDRMLDLVCDEIEKIADTGLKTTNLETAYKLVDIYKDLKTVEAMEQGGYSETNGMNNSYGRGSSYRSGNRRGYSRDGYSKEGYSGSNSYRNGDGYSRYMDAKANYRTSHSGDCKAKLMDAVSDYMEDFTAQLEDMMQDSDCTEERQTIQRYINKIKQIQ